MLAGETGTKVGETTGCPHFELPAFRKLVKKISDKAMMDIGKKVAKALLPLVRSLSLSFPPPRPFRKEIKAMTMALTATLSQAEEQMQGRFH